MKRKIELVKIGEEVLTNKGWLKVRNLEAGPEYVGLIGTVPGNRKAWVHFAKLGEEVEVR